MAIETPVVHTNKQNTGKNLTKFPYRRAICFNYQDRFTKWVFYKLGRNCRLKILFNFKKSQVYVEVSILTSVKLNSFFCFVLGRVNIRSATFHFITLIDILAVHGDFYPWVLPARCIERLLSLSRATGGIPLGYPPSLAPQTQLPVNRKYTEQADINYWFLYLCFLFQQTKMGTSRERCEL